MKVKHVVGAALVIFGIEVASNGMLSRTACEILKSRELRPEVGRLIQAIGVAVEGKKERSSL